MILEMPYVKFTCKIGQGHDCCRYLVMGTGGFECAKLTEMKGLLDKRVNDHTITARGDNCDGKPMYDSAMDEIER